MYPLIRDRRIDEFRRATSDEALDRIVAGMGEPGAVGIWPGHGTFTTNYGTRINAQLLACLANFHGSQFWNPSMICWGLGAFGLGLTGMLETNTKQDMGEHSQLIVLWAANLASQPNTARHLLAAKRRGAHIATIDVRSTEVAAKSDDVLIIRPGTEVTGIPADRIVGLARRYAGTRPAMIVLGGSSMHKGANGWQAGRAIACLPGLAGNVGIPGGGFGPRHGSAAHGRGLGSIIDPGRRVCPGRSFPTRCPLFEPAEDCFGSRRA